MAGVTILDYIYNNDEMPMFEDMKPHALALRRNKKDGDAWLELAGCFRSRLDHVQIDHKSERWQKLFGFADDVYQRALQELPDNQNLQDAHIRLLAYRDA